MGIVRQISTELIDNLEPCMRLGEILPIHIILHRPRFKQMTMRKKPLDPLPEIHHLRSIQACHRGMGRVGNHIVAIKEKTAMHIIRPIPEDQWSGNIRSLGALLKPPMASLPGLLPTPATVRGKQLMENYQNNSASNLGKNSGK